MSALRITAYLWVKNDALPAFIRFEKAALSYAAKHGATIVHIKRNHAADDGAPHETHVIDFPSQSAFDAYRNDPAMLAMADLRKNCIARTEVATTLL